MKQHEAALENQVNEYRDEGRSIHSGQSRLVRERAQSCYSGKRPHPSNRSVKSAYGSSKSHLNKKALSKLESRVEYADLVKSQKTQGGSVQRPATSFGGGSRMSRQRSMFNSKKQRHAAEEPEPELKHFDQIMEDSNENS